MSSLRKKSKENKMGMEEIGGESLMAIYEICRDVDVPTDKGFVHYHGRRIGHKGMLIDEHDLDPKHLEFIRGRSDLEFVRNTSKDEGVQPTDTDVMRDRFGKEIYFCEKCKKNHRKESKIGIAHGNNVL